MLCDDALPGAAVESTVSWRNDGNARTSNAVLTLELGTLAQFISASSGGRYEQSSGRITWSIGELSPKAEGSAKASFALAEVFPEGDTEFAPEVTLTSTETVPVKALSDPLIVSASALVNIDRKIQVDAPNRQDINVPPAAYEHSLAALEAGSPVAGGIPEGSVVTCRLQISNEGNADARDAQVFEDLPEGATFVSASDAGRYDARKHRIIWTLGHLGAKGSALVRTAVFRLGENADA